MAYFGRHPFSYHRGDSYLDNNYEKNPCNGNINFRDVDTVEWAIDDVLLHWANNMEIRSERFVLGDTSWELKVFPCGRNKYKKWALKDTVGWFEIALCACESLFGGPLVDSSQSFRFTLIGKYGEELASSVPKKQKKWYVTDRLIRSKELKKQILYSNALTVLCEMESEEVSLSEPESDEEFNEYTIFSGLAIVDYSQNDDYNGPSTSQSCRRENDNFSGTSTCAKAEIGISPETSISTETKNGGKDDAEASTSSVEAKRCILPKGVAKALEDYKELLLSERHSNITIKVRNKEFKAHRGILAARTPVFAAMLEHNMKEKATGVVMIEDMDPEVFPDFLEYLYTGQIQNLSSSNVGELFTAADKYQVKELREECLVHMKENLSVENFCGILSLALQHQEMELISLASQFFIKNAVEIVKTTSWPIFMSKNLIAANELFIRHVEFINQSQKKIKNNNK